MAQARSGRRRKRERRSDSVEATKQLIKASQPVINIPPYEVVSEEGIEQIHNASLEILSDVGVDFYDAEAVDILKSHGVKMGGETGETAFFDREMVAEYIAKAPSQFTQIARDPDYNIEIGGNNMVFAPVYGPPFVYDHENGRREATLEDFKNFVKMAYMSPYMHHSGGTVCEPNDEPTHTRHLDMLYSHIKYSTKPFMGSVTSGENAEDSVAMAKLLHGEKIYENPALVSLINVSSPRRYDDRMLGALKVYAKNRQATIISPFLFSGAMAPVGMAGTLVQMNAESLAGIVFKQMVNPGCPVIFGVFQTNIDLQSGAPVFGSPESQIVLYAAAQLARRHKLPFRSGGMFTGSKTGDAQAAYESMGVMLPAVQARVNFVLHAAGWLEGGLASGYEKFVMDCEMLGTFHKTVQGLALDENSFAMEALRTTAVTSHHLGTDHTMKNFRTAFHRADIFDYDPYETWYENGAETTEKAATKKVKKMLKEYETPPLDPAIDESLLSYMGQRKGEIKPEY